MILDLQLDDWVLCRIYKKNNGGRRVDNDKDHDMIDYIFRKIPPTLSTTGLLHHNVSRSSMNFFPGKFSGGYGIFSDGDQGCFYDGGMIGTNTVNHHHNNDNGSNGNDNVIGLNQASSSGPMMMANLKRALPVPYWPVTEEEHDLSPSKRFHGGGGGECSNISSSMMEETQPLMQQQGGVLGDGLFRTTSYQLPGLNWYSS